VIVNRTRDEFLSRSGLAEQQHRGITWRDCLDQLQDLPQCGTVADDLIEVHLAANLFFEIKLLLGELFFEFGDLTVRQGIFKGNGDLARRLAEELDILVLKTASVVCPTASTPSTRP
jgi:hypothetical protein